MHHRFAIAGSFVLAAFVALAGGCAVKQPPGPDAVSRAPLTVDEAMQRRVWPTSVAQYADGQTTGWPTGFIFVPRTNPVWQAALGDIPVFVTNCMAMPIVLLFEPPWVPVTYPRGEIEPSFTAMPPLPVR